MIGVSLAEWEAWLAAGLELANQVVSAAVVLLAFSLLVYVLSRLFRSPVARAFAGILALVLVVYAGDVALYEATEATALRWLRFQWIGIALMPAVYLHFSDEVLRITNLRSGWRRAAVTLSFLISATFLVLALGTELVVRDGVYRPRASSLAAGPLFLLFSFYFLVTVIWGAVNIQRARGRCLTRASRRRATYLTLAFFAPGLGVFPYLLVTSSPAIQFENLLQVVLLLGNIGVATMIVVMAYSVAYFGALTPDRVVKHSLALYLLRGPFVGTCVLFVMLAVPKVQRILGLPRDTVLILAVVGVIVLIQVAISLVRPFIDRLIYRQDQDEIAWIQTLDERLLTTTDLRQFLENNLAALCDLLRVRTGFVAAISEGRAQVEAGCGEENRIEGLLEARMPMELMAAGEGDGGFQSLDGFWVMPLRTQARDATLGILGVEARSSQPDLESDEQQIVQVLVEQARRALEDRHLQQGVFEALGRILPNIERMQRWRGATRYAGSPPLEVIEDSPIYAPEFQQWVKEALGHYWGGPRLSDSPLLSLHVVRQALADHGGNPTRALRAVLNQAIDELRPEGERQMTRAEWLLYNILELKFVRGLKVRDIARRLAISESDLYRKQRIAIKEVARVLSEMEQSGASRQTN